MTQPLIAIVIVGYNSRQDIDDCLSSVLASNYPADRLRVILIDNQSTDDTAGLVRTKYPTVELVVNQVNNGFAGGNNQGYLLAQKYQPDYLVLLNPDTVVTPVWLEQLVATAQQTGAAIVQPKIMLDADRQRINSLGNALHFLGFGYCNHYREVDQNFSSEIFPVPYPSGAACLIDMKFLERVGLFDEKLFMYHEDVDLGWRSNLAGGKVIVDPQAIIYHRYNFGKGKAKIYYMERNRLILMLENYRLATLMLIAPAFLIMEVGIFFYALKNGWWREKLRSYFWIIANLGLIIERRLDVQFKLRKISDREMLKLMTGVIKFQELDNPILIKVVNPIMEVYLKFLRLIVIW